MKKRTTVSLLLISILYNMIFIPDFRPDNVSAYSKTGIETEQSITDATAYISDFLKWLPGWQSKSSVSTGNLILTPGSDESCMNFSWYSKTIGSPAVQISTDSAFMENTIIRGTATSISRSNGTTAYRAANHVSAKNYLQPGKTYYYRYTNTLDSTIVVWSRIYTFSTPDSSSVTAILTGDPQIGASGNITSDTYNWSRTLQQAVQTAPSASFLLSAGDQINHKTDYDPDCIRESEYAGFLYPEQLRYIPDGEDEALRQAGFCGHYSRPAAEDGLL